MFSDLIYWRDNLGVLPVNLEHNQDENMRKYAMLDGDINNFALAFIDIYDDDECRNAAWSANMRNYVIVHNDKVILNRTSSKTKEEYGYSLVKDNLYSFYKYLSFKQEEPTSIVNFLMEEYGKIRSALREVNGEGISLTALLYMLTSVKHKITKDNLEENGLPDNTIDIISTIKDNSLIGQIIEEVKKGTDGLKPDITLLLRHASGRLFEEANFVASFPAQMSLFPSNELKYSYDPRTTGAFYTPTYIARSVVEYALNNIDLKGKQEITIFDPASGSGEFIVESLRQLKSSGYNGNVNIIGYDISLSAKIIANYVLTFEALEWGDKLTFKIEQKDSIKEDWPKVDIIFMNPPYSSWDQMDKGYYPYIRERLGIKKGRPNMASLFYHKAVRSLKEGGVVGCVMPTTFLYSSFTEPIRNSSLEYARPIAIARLGNFVFARAYVDVCAVIAKNSTATDSTAMVWTKNVDNVVPETLRQMRKSIYNQKTICDDPHFSFYNEKLSEIKDKNVWMPLSSEMHKKKISLEMKVDLDIFTRVGKIFDVMQGARTGANKYFKVSKVEYKNFTANEKKYFRPAIDSSSLQGNILSISNYLFFPYDENGVTINSEESLKRECPNFYSIVSPHKNELLGRRDTGDRWWLLSCPREWQYKKGQKLVSGEFGNAKNFTIDDTGDFVVERGCYWKPLEEMDKDKILFYFGIFSSFYFNELLEIYSRQLAGGYWYGLSKKFVKDIPLPCYNKVQEELRSELIDHSRNILENKGTDFKRQYLLVKHLYE
jgi:type I restriction-modification system DNA methylase subunit